MTKIHADKCRKKRKKKARCTCDGSHTFDELYDHRITLFITLCKLINQASIEEGVEEKVIWRARKHDDGTGFDGWFIMGIGKGKGKQITYHLPEKCWVETSFAETLKNSPPWDGHTSDNVITRLKRLL